MIDNQYFLIYFAIVFLFGFLTIIIHYFIGRLFLDSGFFSRIVTGLCFNASVGTILAALAAGAAMYSMMAVLSISVVFGIFKNKCNLNVENANLHRTVVLLFFCFLACLSMQALYLYTLTINPNVYNGHDAYLSGVSLELLRSDYYSRLRIFDNYPVEWGRYHFFSGVLTAIPQAFIPSTNYFTYFSSKLSVIVFFVFAIIEIGWRTASGWRVFALTAFCMLYVFTLLPHQLYWSIYTNNYISIFLLMISLVYLTRLDIRSAIFFIIFFGLSTSRSLIPAIFFIATIALVHFSRIKTQLNFKEQKKYISCPIFFFVLITLVGVFTMVCTGEVQRSPFVYNMLNWLNTAWLTIMSPATIPEEAALSEQSRAIYKPSTVWFLFWMSLWIFISFSRVDQHNIKRSEDVSTVLSPTLRSFLFALIFCMLYLFYTFKIGLLIFYYIAPFVVGFLISQKHLRMYFLTFYVVSFIMIYFLDASISIVNYALVEWIVFFMGVMMLKNLIVDAKNVAVFFGVILLLFLTVGVPMNPLRIFEVNQLDSSTSLHKLKINLSSFAERNKMEPFCYRGDPHESAIFSALGRRVTYSDDKSVQSSVSLLFASPTEENRNYVEQICE